MQNTLFKKIILNTFIIIFLVFFFDKNYTIALESFIDNNNDLSSCPNPNNCVLENWDVGNSNNSFIELIEILKTTPRIEIINIQDDYLHALATSRIMKYVDDIEVKKYESNNTLKVKSRSRTGFYDLGVNKRRINTLHFRLIDIYE